MPPGCKWVGSGGGGAGTGEPSVFNGLLLSRRRGLLEVGRPSSLEGLEPLETLLFVVVLSSGVARPTKGEPIGFCASSEATGLSGESARAADMAGDAIDSARPAEDVCGEVGSSIPVDAMGPDGAVKEARH